MFSLLLKLRLPRGPLWSIFELNFLRQFAVAMLTSLVALHFRRFVDSDAMVSFIFFCGYLASAAASLFSSRIIERLKRGRTLLLVTMGISAVFSVYAFIAHTPLLLLAHAIYQFLMGLFITDISLYIKHYSNYRTLALNQGKLGSLGNLGWLIGPIIGAILAEKTSIETVFLVSSFITIIGLVVIFFSHLEETHERIQHPQPLAAGIKHFFKSPLRARSYAVGAGIGFIHSLWDLLPLLMAKLNASLAVIGLARSLMGLNQSLFEYPLGRLAARETGERRLLIVGYILAGAGTIALGLSTNLKLFITFFFIASLGTAAIERMRDSYFFRLVSERDVAAISVYRTCDSLPFVIGQGLAVALLSIVSVHGWFIIGGALTLLFALQAYRLKELKFS